MAFKEILLLGNPDLYLVSEPVEEDELDSMIPVIKDMHDTMLNFRKQYGTGRAIAAPQIGEKKRIIYMNYKNPVVFINPVLTDKSDEMIELWDDCMSFPELLVKVRRHKFITVEYRDLEWREKKLRFSDDMAELIQHEYDHLDGILAIQRAIDGRSFSFKSQVELLQKKNFF